LFFAIRLPCGTCSRGEPKFEIPNNVVFLENRN
jgi:hypothetical protein